MSSIFRDNLLKDKVALLTGGGSGITQRMAERFAEHGAKVMLIGRKQDKLDVAAALIQTAGGIAATFAADVRDFAAMQAAVDKTKETFGLIDIVVCGAAGNFPAAVAGMSANAFKSVIDIDLLGTFNTCRAAYDSLRKPGAAVISISATHAFLPIAFQSHVCAGKAGVEILMKTIAVEWGPAVRANCISPGPTEETEGIRRLAPTEEMRAKITNGIPMRRYGTKDELADLALFLCSEAASFITGAVYICDGGQSLVRSATAFSDLVGK